MHVSITRDVPVKFALPGDIWSIESSLHVKCPADRTFDFHGNPIEFGLDAAREKSVRRTTLMSVMNDSTLMPPPEFLLNLLIKHLQQVPGRRRLQRKTFSRKRAECELTSKIIFGAHRPNRKNSIAPCYLLLINQDMRLWWAWPQSTLRGQCLFTKKLFISADLTLKMVKSDL